MPRPKSRLSCLSVILIYMAISAAIMLFVHITSPDTPTLDRARHERIDRKVIDARIERERK